MFTHSIQRNINAIAYGYFCRMNLKNTVVSKLEKTKSAVILSHKSPDGDSIGSSLAIWNYLTSKGINAKVITPDPAPDFLSWLHGFEQIVNYEQAAEESKKALEESDLIFCLDFNDPSRIGEMQETLEANNSAFKINIDHHRDPKDFCHLQYVDIYASSTAELIYNFIEELDELSFLNRSMAEGIYTGILTDTGSFRFSSTTERTHYIASKMIALGVESDVIYRRVYDSYSSERLKLLGYSLYHSLKLYHDEKIAVIALDSNELKRFHFKRGDTEGLVNFPLSIKNVLISILLTEKDGLTKMSFRSKGEIPVNVFANKYFGGGGHLNAAGGASTEGMPATLLKLESHLSELLEE